MQHINNYSAVIKLTYDEVSFLFAGDAEELSESEMLKNSSKNLKSDVLKVGHHGSETSTSASFFKAVSPKYAVVSVGSKNKYGHPNQELINRLEELCRLYRTDINGNVVMKTDGKTIIVTTR